MRPPQPEPGSVHVWAAQLDDSTMAVDSLASLSETEQQRAASFVFEKDARHYRAARVFQRQVLAAYLDRAPEDLHFTTRARGKPVLTNGAGIEFNVTDSGGFALMAVMHHAAVGIDVEVPRPFPDILNIARNSFHPFEQQEIFAHPTLDAQRQAFYRCWTRKEAYMKALGEGLYLDLGSFAVETGPTRRPALRSCARGDKETWTFVDIGENHAIYAAICIEGQLNSIDLWHWRGVVT
ncbi:4'-phosphopantetheinyl transferase superfamily protein [Roseovarius aestuarii]|nr:4'-phosphopantetheinyl transferase superfamily protein [Roseovarius aestuarii]